MFIYLLKYCATLVCVPLMFNIFQDFFSKRINFYAYLSGKITRVTSIFAIIN